MGWIVRGILVSCVLVGLARVAPAQVSLDDVKERVTGRPGRLAPGANRPANSNPQQNTPPVAKSATPPSVVFLVDLTGSMLSNEKRVKEELIKALNELADGQMFNLIVTFADQTKSFTPKLVPAGKASRKNAIAFVEALKVVGGNGQLEKSLQNACALKPDILWFVSDGDFQGPDTTASITDELLKIATPAKVKISTSLRLASHDVTQGYGRAALAKLAQATGGLCVNDAGDPATEADLTKPPVPKSVDQPETPSIFIIPAPTAKPH